MRQAVGDTAIGAGGAIGVTLYTFAFSPILAFPAVLAFLHLRGVTWIGPFDVLWGNRFVRLTFLLAVLAPGIIVDLRTLREGIRVQRWPGKAVEDLRRQVNRPIWTVVGALHFWG